MLASRPPRRYSPSLPIPHVPTSIELFTGAGGLALGVAQAGFDHRLLVEYNRDACRSLRLNFPHLSHGDCALHAGDVKEVDFRVYRGQIDVLAAGAPCQPFSIGGKHRAHSDERNLFPEVFRAVRDIAPRAVIVENVKGLVRESFAPYVEYIELQLAMPDVQPADPERWQEHVTVLKRLKEKEKGKSLRASRTLRYRVNKRLLNAADYGVPQKRERVFIVAVRDDVGEAWPGVAPTHSEHALLYEQWVTGEYWKRHRLPQPEVPTRLRRRVERLRAEGRPKTAAWRTVRDALAGLPEPTPRAETGGVLNHVGQPGARSYPGHTGSPLDEPAKTLKAGVHGVPGGENMLRRPDGSVRYFTVREAATIQTFPETYHVQGAWGEALRQLGNAVPVKLAEAVARSVRELLTRSEGVDRRRSARETSSPALAEL